MLREYQQHALQNLRRAIAAGSKRPVFVLSTGGGKTHLAAAVIQGAIDKGRRVLFLAPRRELIYQAAERLGSLGIRHGVIMAGEPMEPIHPVQVASKDTLHARRHRMEIPDAQVVIVDEAHLSLTESWKEVIAMYPNAVVIGLTATPARGDGRGLGEVYDDLVIGASMPYLISMGYLVPARYYSPSEPDLAGIRKDKDGDYQQKDLGDRMDQPELIGDVVEHWERLASERRTVVFCVNRAHSRHIAEQFRAKGYTAEHLDGETPLDERKAILARVATGETQILTNVFVASYGLDVPALSCAVLARPTRNITLYLQTVGRVLRPHEGKDDALIIDHSGAVREHGFVDEEQPWSLDGKETVQERKKKQKEENKEPKEIKCGTCGAAFKAQRNCPECGAEVIPQGKPVPVHEAELEEITGSTANREDTWQMKRDFMAQLRGYAREKGYQDGWAAWQYRKKYGVWPNDKRVRDVPAETPGDLAMGWVKHQAIKKRNSKEVAN